MPNTLNSDLTAKKVRIPLTGTYIQVDGTDYLIVTTATYQDFPGTFVTLATVYPVDAEGAPKEGESNLRINLDEVDWTVPL